VHQHQADDGQVACVSKTGPEARHFIHREGDDVEPGFLDAQPADLESGSTQSHRPAMQEGLMEPVRHLTGSIGELVADGAIGSGNAIVDGGCGGAPFDAGLVAQVIKQSRFGEILLGDIASVMNALPPAHEVQQAVRVAV
jgi:hypothetical protein